MGIFIKLAFRNLLRNKKRTIISSIAIGFGLMSIILYTGLTNGMIDNMISSGTKTFSGEGEIVKNGYNKDPKIENIVQNAQKTIDELKKESSIANVSPRNESLGMIKSARDFSMILITGIEPNNEKNVSELFKSIKKGKYLNQNDLNSILISKRTAKKLGVALGDKIVLTSPQANSKDLSEELFRVEGIFSFGMRDIDKNIVFINIKKAKSMIKINAPHKIIFNFKNIQDSRNKKLKIWQKYNKDGNIILSWEEMIPELYAMLGMMSFSLWLTAFILYILVSAGILNTLFMSIYERMFEFGVLRSIGTRKSQLGFMIILEAFWLGIFSIIIGSIMSVVFTILINSNGGITTYSGVKFAGATIKNSIFININIMESIQYSIALLIFILLISIYPAIHAARITPSNAMRERKI